MPYVKRFSLFSCFFLYLLFRSSTVFDSIKPYSRNIESYDDFLTNARRLGYHGEIHEVSTEDGYVLSVFRVYRGPTPPNEVMLLQHGIMDSADAFLNNAVHIAPAYVLANAGFDVWIGNSRGNRYSRKHKYLNPDTDS